MGVIRFPIAKINLGLNIVERRPDGYHNLETVFYPVPIKDVLEVFPMDEKFPSSVDCDLKVSNIQIEGDEQKNLVVRAYQLLKQDFPQQMQRVHARLFKRIPTQAGMGGGSSDSAVMISLLNDLFVWEPIVRSLCLTVLSMPRVSANECSPYILI